MRGSKTFRGMLLTVCVLGMAGTARAEEAARSSAPEMILYNGIVLTMDGSHAARQAVAISGDRIAAVGTDAEIRALAAKTTRLIDLGGKTVLPGFIDSKVFGPFGTFETLHGVRLTDPQGTPMVSPDEIASAIQSFLSASKVESGAWLVAAGFDARMDGSKSFTREWADQIAPAHPLLMLSLDHHLALLNSQAIEKLALKTLEFPEGSGQIERDAKGEPTGVLREMPVFLAMNRLWGQISPELRRQATASFMDAAGRFGITTVATPLALAADLQTAEDLLKDGELPIRVVAQALGANEEARAALESYARERKSPNADRLQVGPPIYPVDGSMLSGKAALFQAYKNAPWTSGSLSMSPDRIDAVLKESASGSEGAVLDASGSLAVHLLIDASQQYKASGAATGTPAPVFRVDGLDLVEGSDRGRLGLLAQSGWIVSLQPTRFPYRVYLAKAIGDERMKEALPYRSLVDAGVKVAINSNWPMSAMTFQPTQVMKWAVTRSGWRKEEGLSVEQALRAYTTNAAGALGLSAEVGSIEAGKKADLVILDRNPLDLESTPDALPDVAVRMTIASGSVVFEERKTAAAAPAGKTTVVATGKGTSGGASSAPALPGAAQD